MSREESNSNIIYIIITILVFSFIILGFIFAANGNNKTNDSHQSENTGGITMEVDYGNKIPIPQYETYKFLHSFKVKINSDVKNLVIKIPVPMTEEEKQFVVSRNFSIKPTRSYKEGLNAIAEFSFPELGKQEFTININTILKLKTYNLQTAKAINKNLTPEKDLTRYLKPEKYIESDSIALKLAAKRIKGTTQEEIVHNIYKFVQQHMTYKITPQISGAKRAYAEKIGKCSEYAALMVALCRAKGIPARIITGDVARGYDVKHNWVEVYYDKYGWVLYDPTVMGGTVKRYHNGKLVSVTTKYESDKTKNKYITCARNIFTPYYADYRTEEQYGKQVEIIEDVVITKIQPQKNNTK